MSVNERACVCMCMRKRVRSRKGAHATKHLTSKLLTNKREWCRKVFISVEAVEIRILEYIKRKSFTSKFQEH